MELYCAACGCLVDRGTRVVACASATCCCRDLPLQLRSPQRVADELRAAFATKDLAGLGRLLAADARWGDDDSPTRCRSRADVVATFARLLDEGVDGRVTETVTGPKGVAIRLSVEWPHPGDGREADFYQSYRVAGGVVTEIQHHDSRRAAIAAIRS